MRNCDRLDSGHVAGDNGVDRPRMEAMLRPSNNLKAATTLGTLVVVVVAGFTPVARAGRCIEHCRVTPAAGCVTAAPCCCGTTSETRACRCRQNGSPEPQPPATPNDTGRTIKWIPWLDTPQGLLTKDAPERSRFLPPVSFHTPIQRSIQSLLCIWRI
jgi:hypothetical protein